MMNSNLKPFAVFGLLLTATASFAEPKIVCDENVFDFGRLVNSETAEHVFEIRNEGDEVLKITETKTTCGCTVARITDRTVEPGEKTEITARVKLQGRTGRQAKSIFVKSNDKKNSTLTLTMKGSAFAELEVKPQRLYLGTVSQGTPIERPVDFISGVGPFTITKVESLSDSLEIRVEREGEQEENRVHVRLSETTPTGRLSTRINVHTTLKPGHTVNIDVTANVVGPLGVEPQKIVLLNSRPTTRYVSIRPGQVQDFKVLEVEAPMPEIQVRTFPAGKSGYRIQLSNVIGSAELHGKTLRIKTDAQSIPLIEIPFEFKGTPTN